MLELLGRLTDAPVRPDGVLDMPFDEYAKDVSSPQLLRLLQGYARPQRNPTLRGILQDPRFRRWIEISARSPVRRELEVELAIVSGVIDVEESLSDEEPPAPPKPEVHTSSIVEWAHRSGVAARLREPVGVLAQGAKQDLWQVLHFSREATVQDAIEGDLGIRLHLTPAEQKALRALGTSYIREAGERVLAERTEEQRLAALAHLPEGEGARAFVAALDAALRSVPSRRSMDGATITKVTLRPDPFRVDLQVQLPPRSNGSLQKLSAALHLDDWRSFPLATRVFGKKTLDEMLLRAVRRILGDPAHPLYRSLVAYLDEAPWTRVLAKIDALGRRGAFLERRELHVEWRVSAAGNVVPYVLDEGAAASQTTAEAIARGQVGRVSPRDEAVAHTLYDPVMLYSYGPPSAGRSRERTFLALRVLGEQGRVVGRGGVPLGVHVGSLDLALEREAGGFRFVVSIDGVRLEAREVRAALDDKGYLIHVDHEKGHALLAHVGAERAAIVATLLAEDAVFPAPLSATLVDRLHEVRRALPLQLPVELAGEGVDADPRPYVRLVREGVLGLSVSFFVRPIDGGPLFAPGSGPEQVLHRVDGRAVFANRSRDTEKSALDALRVRLPEPLATGPLNLRCQGYDAMLAVTEVLRAAVEAGEAVVEWPRSLPRVIGSASWAKLRINVSAQRDWFGVSGTVDVDGTEVSLKDLLAAQRHRERFVVLGPEKLVAITDELRDRLDALDAMGRPSKTGLELVGAAVPSLTELFPSRDQLDAPAPFWALLDRIEAARTSEPKLPRGFAKILRPYQVEGFRWMSRLAAWGAGACLADEMGLGKTVQTLALLVARSAEGPALVVAPTSVGPNWIHEVARFAPSLRAILHRGTGRSAALGKLGAGDLLVTSYEILVRDQAALSRIAFATVVVDEAQAVKNGATARARAVRSLDAGFRLALTGTPVENRLAELYSLMEFLNPGFFGGEDSFRARFVVPIERDKDRARSDALARAVRPFLLRRKKADVLTELPARTEIARSVERSAGERKLYEAARRVALDALAGADEQARFQVLAEIMRLRRLACHPRLYDEASTVPSSKLEAFLALVTELIEGGHRALVFSQFTGHLALVEEALRAQSTSYLYLDGKTPLAERTKRVAAFQSGDTPLFLISLKAGGTGLNLTAADTVIHLDPWWNPAVEDQASDRAHRIGQTRPVTVIRLVAQGTIEETVLALHAEKRELAEAILEGSAAGGKLSIGELGALIREGAGL